MSKIKYLDNKIEDFRNEIVDEIFSSVDAGEITKLDAIGLFCKSGLFEVHNYCKYPKFMNDYFIDRTERYETVMFYNVVGNKTLFKRENEESFKRHVLFKDITQEEAIDKTYEFIKEEGCIGCVNDW